MAQTKEQAKSQEPVQTHHSKFRQIGMGNCEVASTRIDATHRLAVLYCDGGDRQQVSINTLAIDPKTQRDVALNLKEISKGYNIEVRVTPEESTVSYGSAYTMQAPIAAPAILAAIKRVHADGRLDKKEAFQLDALRALTISTFTLPEKLPLTDDKLKEDIQKEIKAENLPVNAREMSLDDQTTITAVSRTVAKNKSISK